jgi:hypothetical protein
MNRKPQIVGNEPRTVKEYIIYDMIEKYLNLKKIDFWDIWVHEVNGRYFINIGNASLYEDFKKYGYKTKYVIIFSNILRFIFQDVEIEDIDCGYFKIGGI